MSGVAFRIVRGIGGVAFAMGSMLLGANACVLSGAYRRLSEVDPPRLLNPQAFGWTAGAVTFALLSILAGRSGRGAIATAGVPLVPIAIVLGIAGGVHTARGHAELIDVLPLTLSGLVLTVASMFAMSHESRIRVATREG